MLHMRTSSKFQKIPTGSHFLPMFLRSGVREQALETTKDSSLRLSQ